MTFDDIIAYLHAKGVTTTCPSCTSTAWSINFIPATDSADTLAGVYSLAGSPMPEEEPSVSEMFMRGRPFVPLICANCGFTKLYDFAMISNWVRERAVSDESAEKP